MATKKRLLITAKWCGGCSDVKKALKREGIKFKAVDIDSKEGKRIDSKHRILHVPTMIINGKHVTNPEKWL